MTFISETAMEKILTDEMFSPDYLFHTWDSAEPLLFENVDEWYAVASLLIGDVQVSMVLYLG